MAQLKSDSFITSEMSSKKSILCYQPLLVQYDIWTSSISIVNIQEKEKREELSEKCEHVMRQSVSRET